MKTNYKFLSIIQFGLIIGLFVGTHLLVSCGDDPVSETERVTSLLTAHPWKVSSVTVDNVSQSALFTNFAITFTATGFSTTNGAPVWPASGTWSFTDDNARAFTRGDGILVTIADVSSSALHLELVWSEGTLGSGKISSIAGTHVFQLIP